MSKIPRTQNARTADYGVSEMIGGILMISVVIAAVAIIGLVLLSQTTPTKIPNINFMTGTDNGGNLYLFHNGGDSLTLGTFSVVVDGVTKSCSAGSATCQLVGGGTDWSLGKNLLIPGVSSGQHSVSVVYNNTGSGMVVIRSGTADVIVPATPIINPDIIAASAYPPVISVPQLMQNITNNSVSYYRENGTYIASGYIQFNVTAINSTVYTTSNTVPVQLNVGDVVRITPSSLSQVSPGVRIFGTGDQIWELTAEKAVFNVSNRSSNPAEYTGAINHTWITGYKDFQSTLSISTVSGSSFFTELAVNNYPSSVKAQTFSSQIINGTSSRTIVVSNLKPLPMGLFVLQYDNRTKSSYFAGNAALSVT
jgi:hypothetical protein